MTAVIASIIILIIVPSFHSTVLVKTSKLTVWHEPWAAHFLLFKDDYICVHSGVQERESLSPFQTVKRKCASDLWVR